MQSFQRCLSFSWHYLLPHGVRKLLPIHSGRGYLSCVPQTTPTLQPGNINPVSIDYAFRPRLRSRLTLRGRTFRRKPWAFGVLDSHQYFRYLSRHSHFCIVHTCLPLVLLPLQNAPLPILRFLIFHSFGKSLSPVHFRRRSA